MASDLNSSTSQPRHRKWHSKRRSGCETCKKRRKKCDEGKPICLNCLTRGDQCYYLDISIQASTKDHKVPSQLLTLLPATPADPFDTLPHTVIYKSQELMHHFVQCRQDLRQVIGKNPLAEMIQNTFMNPGFIENAIMEAALHRAALESKGTDIATALVCHKLELIKSIKTRLASLDHQGGTWPCIDGMAILAMVERYFEDTEAAKIHLRGIFAIVSKEIEAKAKFQYGYADLRLTLLMVSLVEGAKISRDGFRVVDRRSSFVSLLGSNPANWINAAYRAAHLNGEFIVDPEIHHLEGKKSGPIDATILIWFIRAVEGGYGAQPISTELEVLENTKTRQMQRMADEDKRVWVAATAAYVLLMAGVTRLDGSPGSCDDDDITGRQLQRLQEWFNDVLQRWIISDTLPSQAMMEDVLEKMAWLTTSSGRKVVERILENTIARQRCAVSQDVVQSFEAIRWRPPG